MTCEEYRETINKNTPFGVSRGVRASIQKHYQECQDCREHTDEVKKDPRREAIEAKYGKAIDALKKDDLKDPEFRETIK